MRLDFVNNTRQPMHAMINCECGRKFENGRDVRQHRKAVHSRTCPQCNRRLTTPQGLEQHIRDVHRWECGHCREHLPGRKSLNRHRRSTRHCFCGSCNQFFRSTEKLRNHQKASHVDHFRCCECDREFVNETALKQHLRDKKKHIAQPGEQSYVCDKCNRKFLGVSALKQHESSLVHNAISDLECIDAHCNKRFRCPSSFLHHLESGTCVSKMDRDKLNKLICAHDTDHMISNQRYLWAAVDIHSESSDKISDFEVIYTPDTTSSADLLSISPLALASEGPSSSENAIEISPKARCWECSKTFTSMYSLEQHRDSAAHAKPTYHFPEYLSRETHSLGFIRTFKTLSGLAQHLEAKSGVGGASTLCEVAAYIEDRLKQFGWKAKILKDS